MMRHGFLKSMVACWRVIGKTFAGKWILLGVLLAVSVGFLAILLLGNARRVALSRGIPIQPEMSVQVERGGFKPIYGKVITRGLSTLPKIALTFDADMTPSMREWLAMGKVKSYFNRPVVDVLRRTKTPATFFLAALWADYYRGVVRDLAADPLFEIGNHSYSHPAFSRPCFNLPPISKKQKDEEFALSQKVIREVIGRSPQLFRFPGGCYEKSDLGLAQKYGMTVIGWDVDSRDAFNSDAKVIINSVVRAARPGSIVVFHLHGSKNAPATAGALPEVISFLSSRGYTFVTVGDLLRDLNASQKN